MAPLDWSSAVASGSECPEDCKYEGLYVSVSDRAWRDKNTTMKVYRDVVDKLCAREKCNTERLAAEVKRSQVRVSELEKKLSEQRHPILRPDMQPTDPSSTTGKAATCSATGSGSESSFSSQACDQQLQDEDMSRLEAKIDFLQKQHPQVPAPSTADLPKSSQDIENLKETARQALAHKDFKKASEYLSDALQLLEFVPEALHDLSWELWQRATLSANRALAWIKQEQWEAAEEDCNATLRTISTHISKANEVKVAAFYRRCVARHKRGQHDEAFQDVEQGLRIFPCRQDLLKLKAQVCQAMESSVEQIKARMLKEVGRMIAEGTSAAARKRALRCWKLEWHPDKNANKVAKEVFQFLPHVEELLLGQPEHT
ncbi:RPAP3 [Symbiodinium sp. CCMP2592]|nr:RPAP3 [Symbiodinium sp. CCMP2592]